MNSRPHAHYASGDEYLRGCEYLAEIIPSEEAVQLLLFLPRGGHGSFRQ
jgi:hypothetical protein